MKTVNDLELDLDALKSSNDKNEKNNFYNLFNATQPKHDDFTEIPILDRNKVN
jgi:hypothetical protein